MVLAKNKRKMGKNMKSYVYIFARNIDFEVRNKNSNDTNSIIKGGAATLAAQSSPQLFLKGRRVSLILSQRTYDFFNQSYSILSTPVFVKKLSEETLRSIKRGVGKDRSSQSLFLNKKIHQKSNIKWSVPLNSCRTKIA